jgi:Domain of unknown function (DUF4845)/Prokaryotic N-terminal methylation motif
MGNSRHQRGLTLVALISVLAIVGIVVLFAFKISPAWIEYYSIRQTIKGMASSGDLAKAIPAIRTSFDKRAEVGYITTISGRDLEITRSGDGYNVGFNYRKEIPVVGNMSVVFDFKGSTGEAPRKRTAD